MLSNFRYYLGAACACLLGLAADVQAAFVTYDGVTEAFTWDLSVIQDPLVEILGLAIGVAVVAFIIVRGWHWVRRLIAGSAR